ncbi:outer membrane protein assembly factor BamD [Nitrosomonas sp. Nm33]|uniref:outer membrane protein assembly factor BamD n=1 Tax=Nitrosomonas sp. Nm33 TaxID=133724 RepID=UPI0008989A6E|nr:outer membrane protein assembly factor BamD [Nitrosomonas sp. Nm33]SDY42031.1 outer membrane protein assembly factor BamD [Nitrosomonas sp. Nm33]
MWYRLILVLVFGLSACGLLKEKSADNSHWSPNKFYSEAKNELNNGNYEKAVKLFEALEARYPYGRYAQQAQLEIAYAYYKDQQQASAIAAADRFIQLYPHHPNVDYAYYIKGLANFHDDLGIIGYISSRIINQDMSERDSKASRESFENFKELVIRFPKSKYTPDALKRMAHLVNVVAKSEIYVARYYMKRKAYVAAARRAQYVLEEYPQTPATEEALYIMAKAYDEMGMNDLRDDAERVMRKNFPESEFFSDSSSLGKEAWWKIW